MMKTHSHSVGDAGSYLKEWGIMPSFTRKRILEYLDQSPDQPTVEMIYQGLQREIPNLSKTTVYNTLRLFLEHRIAKDVPADDEGTRYELRTAFHGHLKCSICGEVLHVPVEISLPQPMENLTIEDTNVVFRGVCPDCMLKRKKEDGQS